MLGSSLLAAAIPLVVFLLPDASNKRDSDLASGSGEPPSRGGGGGGGGGGLHGRVETVMGWIERSIEHLPNFPRLHPQECVKRSICEAHNEPAKYGAIGFTLRLLFP